tara:strand:- start:5252 stop:6085 length:834 start_codon:yes stop_codon:yes gene_type:complete
MKIFNVGIVGYGKMGKIFAKEIKKKSQFRLVDVLTKTKIKNGSQSIKNFFNSKNINLFIISSPIETHMKYLKLAYKAKKNIIIEKPIVKNLNQLKKLSNINKNYSKKIAIHHNDVLNFEKHQIMNKFYKFKNINKIKMIYGKYETVNSYKKPFIDWLPHPLAIIINFFGIPKKFDIIKYSKKIKKKVTFEKLELAFYFNYLKIFVEFSNYLKVPTKKIIFYNKKQNEIYNGYCRKNQKTVKLLLEKFYNKNKINDISSNLKVYELLFKIENRLSKKN